MGEGAWRKGYRSSLRGDEEPRRTKGRVRRSPDFVVRTAMTRLDRIGGYRRQGVILGMIELWGSLITERAEAAI